MTNNIITKIKEIVAPGSLLSSAITTKGDYILKQWLKIKAVNYKNY